MNRRWFSSFSFKSLWLALSAATLCGCSDLVGTGGESDLSSKTACPGEGGLYPAPVAPQALRAKDYDKFAIPKKLLKEHGGLPANTPLVAVVNEICILDKPNGPALLSHNLRKEVEAQPSPVLARAYPLRLKSAYASKRIMELVNEDPCLLHLGEDTELAVTETVNDTHFSSLTHLTNIEAPTAWDTFHSGLSGSVVIAIIDDGMQMNHPDLASALWTNSGETAGNGIDDDGNGYVDDVNGYNFVSNIGSPAHQNGAYHGTHVAGLAAAVGNNGVGVSGVMGRNAEIMVLNVFGSGATTSSARIVNAINYARNNGAKVINMSLGGSGTASSVQTAMVNAVAAGVFVASAAGNDNREVTATGFYMPMGYSKDIDGAIAVGSIDATTSMRSSFSNWSTTYVEIGAPGSNSATGGVLSTYTTSNYAYLQGTSMATPVLAGGAALLIGWGQSQGRTVTPADVEMLMKNSATVFAPLSQYFFGAGRLNLKDLATLAQCSL